MPLGLQDATVLGDLERGIEGVERIREEHPTDVLSDQI